MIQAVVNFLNIFQGLRKTLVMASLMVMACILCVKGYISGANLTDLLKATALGFFTANGCEYIATTVKTYMNSKGQTKEETVVEAEDVK